MPHDENADRPVSDADTRARELIERALTALETEEESALADLEAAEAIARDAGIDELVAAALINRGFIFAGLGDYEAAAGLFTEAATVAREAQDTERLRSALSNLGVVLRLLERFAEAIAAYTELLEMLDDDPATASLALIDRGLSHVELAEHEEAVADFEKAEDVADKAGLLEVVAMARGSQGYAHDRAGDQLSALMLVRESVDIARQAGDDGVLGQALVDLAQLHRRLGQHSDADDIFAQAERVYRKAGDNDALADALYWHGVSLKAGGWSDAAMALWREEEPLRRGSGDDAGLGDCLLAQAGVLRDSREYAQAEALYAEAEAICRRDGIEAGLASALYNHAKLLRADGRSDEALALVQEAVDVAVGIGFAEIEARARVLKAMVHADLDDTTAASEELDRAEELATEIGLYKTLIWLMARRAYVFARQGLPAEEVVAALRQAHRYAIEQKLGTTGRSAVKAIITEIRSRCGDAYDEALEAARQELIASRDGGMPPV